MCGDKYEITVPLQEHLEKMNDTSEKHLRELMALHLAAQEKAVNEARRVMEERMAGFPGEYAKKSELESTAITLKDLKDRDLREIKDEIDKRMFRAEYEVQHKILGDKIDSQEKRVQGAELLKAEVTGKIWTLGIVLSIMVVVLEFIIKFVLKVG